MREYKLMKILSLHKIGPNTKKMNLLQEQYVKKVSKS